MLDKLFKFPVLMIDADREDSKRESTQTLGLPSENEDPDFIIGYAEVPYTSFIGICDRWYPTNASVDSAISKSFDASFVMFGESGSYLCPWTRKEFKIKLQDFISSLNKD